MTIRKVTLYYAKHPDPDREWMLIPEPWFDVYRQAGAEIYKAPKDTPPVSVPTPVDGKPSGLEVVVEEGEATSKGAVASPSSPALDAAGLNPTEAAAMAEQMAVARREMAAHPAPTSHRHEAFIVPQFRAEVSAPQRCASCGDLYARKPMGDDGRCQSCRSARMRAP